MRRTKRSAFRLVDPWFPFRVPNRALSVRGGRDRGNPTSSPPTRRLSRISLRVLMPSLTNMTAAATPQPKNGVPDEALQGGDSVRPPS
jgi:hypothetical protein